MMTASRIIGASMVFAISTKYNIARRTGKSSKSHTCIVFRTTGICSMIYVRIVT